MTCAFVGIDNESPVGRKLAFDQGLAKELHGIERAGSNVQANISEAMRHEAGSGLVQRGPERKFIWQKGAALTNFRVPGDGMKRPVELIPAEELELAILHITEDQFGMLRDHLPRAIARLFEIERLYADAADRIRDVVGKLVERGLLRTNGPQVYLA